ncbi:MAG: integrase [Lachnospiraceae bacterium]|nr:integrase [Lachnospiraceae bacterium]
MAKRKKYPNLPNGFGSIRYLGKGRTYPYAVHPPAVADINEYKYKRPKAICYVKDWYTGFSVLTAYHAGTYEPGMELVIQSEVDASVDLNGTAYLDLFCKRVLKNMSLTDKIRMSSLVPTFAEVFDLWYDSKYGPNAPKKLSRSAAALAKMGFSYCSDVHDLPLDIITIDQLQRIVTDVSRKFKESTVNVTIGTIKNIYKYGITRELISFNTAAGLQVPDTRKNEHGVPFSDHDLAVLWKHIDDPDDDHAAEMMFIMCLAGYRINAWITISVDLRSKSYTGGNKTAAGKNLITPIHSLVLPLVKRRLSRSGSLIGKPDYKFRMDFANTCERLGIGEHTPHDTKHTFSRLCEKYGVRENDRKRMMGHAVGDITNDVYGHRDLEDLRQEIEKIQLDFCGHL